MKVGCRLQAWPCIFAVMMLFQTAHGGPVLRDARSCSFRGTACEFLPSPGDDSKVCLSTQGGKLHFNWTVDGKSVCALTGWQTCSQTRHFPCIVGGLEVDIAASGGMAGMEAYLAKQAQDKWYLEAETQDED